MFIAYNTILCFEWRYSVGRYFCTTRDWDLEKVKNGTRLPGATPPQFKNENTQNSG